MTDLRGRLVALLLGAVLAGPAPPPATAQAADAPVRLTLDQARATARQALAQGRPSVALQLATGLLQADPEDAEAHYIIALASLSLGDTGTSRGAARRAFHYSGPPAERYAAARVAARTAYADGRFTASQFWLRRAVQAAPTDEARAKAISDFRVARRRNPLRFDISAAVRPSNNFSGGTTLDRYRIEDSLWVNVPDTQQALSGTRASVNLQLQYRLRDSARNETSLTGFGTISRARLSDEAREIAPTVQDSDFDYSYAQLGVRHRQLLGAGRTELVLGLERGRRWEQGAPSYTQRSGSATINHRLGTRTRLSFGVQGADLHFVETPGRLYFTRRGFVTLGYTRANGDRLTGTLQGLRTLSDIDLQTNDAGSAILRYDWAAPLGPVRVGASLRRNWAHYPTYPYLDSSFRIVELDGGRKDVGHTLSLDMTVFQLDYAGFTPTVTLETSKTDSNVPGYTTDSLGVSIGFRSAF